MRIVHLVPGTGNFHCGACLRDHSLAKHIGVSSDHDMVLVPLYLPMVTDHEEMAEAPILLGGINLYLQQKAEIFRRTPRWLDRVLDSTVLLRRASDFAGMTSAHDLGTMTLSSFEGLDGHQRKEWRRLLKWLRDEGKPDVVSLSNGLLTGVARAIREEIGVPVIASFQGEDSFLDGLPEPYGQRSWDAYSRAAEDVDWFVAPSEFAGRDMASRLGLANGQWELVGNGIDMAGIRMREGLPRVPVIGFLSRMCPPKGLDTVVEAFLILRRRMDDVELRIGGAMTPEDRDFVLALKRRIAAAGAENAVRWLPNMTFKEKVSFLRSLTLLSVPSRFKEAFGLFLIEAMAAGVPVVQPRAGAFPEIVGNTGGGWIYDGEGAEALAAAWEEALSDDGEVSTRGKAGRSGVEARYTAGHMARGYASIVEKAVAKGVERAARIG
ncbi:MAG: glycosyltransferase family 4 protein [Verrucomicrobiota bacterium]